jgi:hypothetical protein
MSGYKDFNFPAFFKAQADWESFGWKVWNPAQKDLEMKDPEVFEGDGDIQVSMQKGFSLREALEWDTKKICQSDAIYMLKGWEQSAGANAEWALAAALKKAYPEYEIYYE